MFAAVHLTLVFALLVRLSLVFACDPLTQYESSDGQCCKKCGPGTRMSSDNRNCQDPQCQPCGENEYQDSYTVNTRCKLHPYCDTNQHFVSKSFEHKSKTEQSQCVCEEGYHCSSAECMNCLPHRTCGAGYRVLSKGSPTQDTVCQACPPESFSTGTPDITTCIHWTICEKGFKVKTNGTATSDRICEPKKVNMVVIIIIFICLLLLASFGITLCKVKTARDKLKECTSCFSKKGEMKLQPATKPVDEHIVINEIAPSLPPEENDDENNELLGLGITDNGNVFGQEEGKGPPLPRQESQTS